MFFLAEIFFYLFCNKIQGQFLEFSKVIKNDSINIWKITNGEPRTRPKSESRSMIRSLFCFLLITYVHGANRQVHSYLL